MQKITKEPKGFSLFAQRAMAGYLAGFFAGFVAGPFAVWKVKTQVQRFEAVRLNKKISYWHSLRDIKASISKKAFLEYVRMTSSTTFFMGGISALEFSVVATLREEYNMPIYAYIISSFAGMLFFTPSEHIVYLLHKDSKASTKAKLCNITKRLAKNPFSLWVGGVPSFWREFVYIVPLFTAGPFVAKKLQSTWERKAVASPNKRWKWIGRAISAATISIVTNPIDTSLRFMQVNFITKGERNSWRATLLKMPKKCLWAGCLPRACLCCIGGPTAVMLFEAISKTFLAKHIDPPTGGSVTVSRAF